MNIDTKLVNAVIIGDCHRLPDYIEEFLNFKDQNGQPSTSRLTEVRDRDSTGNTLLHMAVLRCRRQAEPRKLDSLKGTIETNCKLFEILLKHPNPKARIDVSSVNQNDQTPMHLFHSEVQSRADSSASLLSLPLKKWKHEHGRNANTMEHKVYVDEFFKLAFKDSDEDSAGIHPLLQVELRKKAVNAVDCFGYTALHLAVLHKCGPCIQKLVKYGASLNIKMENKMNQSFCSSIRQMLGTTGPSLTFPTPHVFQYDPYLCLNVFEHRLNQGLSFDQLEADDCEDSGSESEDSSRIGTVFNFADIVPRNSLESSQPQREAEFLYTFLNADGNVRKKILSHPLVATFVLKKWKKVEKFFYCSFIFHVAVALLYSLYAYSVYMVNCPYKFVNGTNCIGERRCDDGFGSFKFSIVLLLIMGLSMLLELAKFVQDPFLYLKQWTVNSSQIVMIVMICLSVWPVLWAHGHCTLRWQYSTAAYAIFLVWCTLLVNVGRFPKLGVYVEMYGKVLENFSIIMVAYVLLLLAFTIAFCVLFPYNPPFEHIPRAILKVLTMMSGEVDYGDLFYGEGGKGSRTEMESTEDLLHPVTSHIFYGSFVILVTIVLTNLLTGLAVDDIKVLAQNAEFTKTARQLANIAYVESIIFSDKLPNSSWITRLRKSIVVARLSDGRNSRTSSDANTHKRKTRFQRIGQAVRRILEVLHLCDKPKRTHGTVKASSSMRKERAEGSYKNIAFLMKYRIRLSLEDFRRHKYPEDIYLKAVEIIKRRNTTTTGNGTGSVVHQDVLDNGSPSPLQSKGGHIKHCVTCKCQNITA